MTKKEFWLLERVYGKEIEGALANGPRMFQENSSLVESMVQRGLLERVTEVWYGVTLTGVELTTLGHMEFCSACYYEE